MTDLRINGPSLSALSGILALSLLRISIKFLVISLLSKSFNYITVLLLLLLPLLVVELKKLSETYVRSSFPLAITFTREVFGLLPKVGQILYWPVLESFASYLFMVINTSAAAAVPSNHPSIVCDNNDFFPFPKQA